MTQPNRNSTLLILPSGFELGGVTNWTLALAEALLSCGRPVTIVPHGELTTPPEEWKRLAEISHGLGDGVFAGRAGPEDVERFAAHYARFLPATIIPNFCHGGYAACALLKLQNPERLRVIGWVHTDERSYYDSVRHYAPLLDAVVGVSSEICARLERRVPSVRDRLCERPYAVSTAGRPFERERRPAGVPLRIGYAGRLIERQKRVWRLVDVALGLHRAGVAFELAIAGDGPERIRLQAALADSAAASAVRFLGQVPAGEMPAFWAQQDVCLLVSDYEGTSITMLEAMGTGSVPVVPCISGVSGVVREGVNGEIYPRGNMGRAVQALRRLAGSPDLLLAQGREAARTVAERFAPNDYLQWFLELEGKIWSRPSLPWPRNRAVIDPTGQLRPTAGQRLKRLARGALHSLGIDAGKLRRRVFGKHSRPWLP